MPGGHWPCLWDTVCLIECGPILPPQGGLSICSGPETSILGDLPPQHLLRAQGSECTAPLSHTPGKVALCLTPQSKVVFPKIPLSGGVGGKLNLQSIKYITEHRFEKVDKEDFSNTVFRDLN